MSVDGWNTVLVLGGIRSGKSEFAESLVTDAPVVRYVATAPEGDPEDTEWATRLAAHRARRPGSWTTEETTEDPRRLADVLESAEPNEMLLVDDLGGWVTVLLDPDHQPADDVATIAELAEAIRGCAARVVLVSPEVGLSLVPTTPLGRAFTDALGAANRAVADACDAVVLVVAGQPVWLKPAATATEPSAPATATAPTARCQRNGRREPGRRRAHPRGAAARRADPHAAGRPDPGARQPLGRADHGAADGVHRAGHPARHGAADARRVRRPAGGRPADHAGRTGCRSGRAGPGGRLRRRHPGHPDPRRLGLGAGAAAARRPRRRGGGRHRRR